LHSDTAQAAKLLYHFARLARSRRLGHGITVALQVRYLSKDEFQAAEQPFDLGQRVGRDGFTKAGAKIRQPTTPTLKKRVVTIDAESREDCVDPVG
jgi:hypothetical protein